MLKKLLIALAVVVAAFVVVVAMQPSQFHIVRMARIAAPAPEIFAQVDDLHKWEDWSPWAKLDPAAKTTFDGPPAGTGAVFTWSGNDKVGAGTMTVTESHPSDRVRIKVDFTRPFAGTNITEFTFVPDADLTIVSWNMSGRHNFISKAMCLFVSMDKMLGGDMEKGLAQLRSAVLSARKA